MNSNEGVRIQEVSNPCSITTPSPHHPCIIQSVMRPTTQYLSDARDQFDKYKVTAELAMAQMPDGDLFDVPFAGGNSIVIIAKHLAGNMLSRWTNFLTTDGEKKDRNRDDEFEMDPGWSRDDLMAYWDQGWSCLTDVMDSLTEDDLARSVTIRGKEHSVVRAISRQMTHYATSDRLSYWRGCMPVIRGRHSRSLVENPSASTRSIGARVPRAGRI